MSDAPAVAEIRPMSVTTGAQRHPLLVWTITWRGRWGAFSAGIWYPSRQAAELMARDCGAKAVQLIEETAA